MNSEGIVYVLRGLGIASSCIKPNSEWITAPCPFAPYTHPTGRDRSASFGVSINPDGTSGYNCFSCGSRGSLRLLPTSLTELDGKDRSKLESFIEEQEIPVAFPPWELAGRKEREKPTPKNEEEFDSLFDPAYKKRAAVEYFRSRGISRQFMKEWDLRFDSYNQRVLFKVKSNGKFYGASGRSIRKNPKLKVRVYGHKTAFFLLGEEHLSDDTDKPVVVIEGLMGLGELDALGVYEYADVVSIQGSILSVEQRDKLVALDRHIVLMLDNDEAGKKGLYGTTNRKGAIDMLEGLCDFHVFKWRKGVTEFLDLDARKLKQLVLKPYLF